MLLSRIVLLLALAIVPMSLAGCGGPEAGVADAPDTEEPMQTEEEEAGEEEAAANAAEQ